MGNNPAGRNQWGPNTDLPDDVLRGLFNQFSKENGGSGLSINEQIARLRVRGMIVGKTKLCGIRKRLAAPSVKTAKVLTSYQQREQAVLDLKAKDPLGKWGVNQTRGRLAMAGVLMTRDEMRQVLHDHFAVEFQSRLPGHRNNLARHPLQAVGPWQQVHCDGHEKLASSALRMGPVGINIYSYKDQYSSDDLYLKHAPNVRREIIIGHFFLDFVEVYGCVALQMVMDKGSETGMMIEFHRELRQDAAPEFTTADWPSSIQVQSKKNTPIEGFWSWLRRSDGPNLRDVMTVGYNDGTFNPQNEMHIQLWYWIWPPIVQQHLDEFRQWWNNHRIRRQKNKELPSGLTPNHLYECPTAGNPAAIDCRINVRPEKVQELRNRIGGKAARDELFRYVSQDFEETANAAYAAIGKPLITLEWKQKLDEAIGLRKVVQESNKVFEVETLSADTFLVPSNLQANGGSQGWNHENAYTGKVTCSVPFTTADGRGLVAIGCAEGVWIGFRHDSRSMRRVLHLKMVTQCAMLEDFGIFLVLADKSLFAYHIEALVPSSPQSAHTSQTPQKLSGNKDVHFFSVGNLNGRTLVIYMKKKGLDSVFRVLEPVIGKINERAEAPRTFGSRLGLRSQRSEWFRVYRDFFLPSESFDLIFLKAKIVILCTKGFEIMDLTDFKSVTIPQRDDPRLEKLAKRCESCRPMGMFRSSKDEFLLCYDEFGLYVDRHGDPSRSDTNRAVQTIEWEGTAEHVAWHPPYILLFDSRFIEIRHVETGRLCQIIPGNDMRCIWDGRGASTTNNPPATPGPDGWSEGMSQEPRVHGVMNSDPPGPPGAARGMSTRATAQHVFELIPTIPLYLPGSLSSPSQSTYFAQSNSPPHSPRLNPTLAWR